MGYLFVKIQPRENVNIGDKKNCWLFCAKTENQVLEHWEKYVRSVISDGTRKLVQKAFSGTTGHFTNDFERTVEITATSLHLSITEAMSKVENEAFHTRMNTFFTNGEIFLTHGLTVVLIDDRFFRVAETVEKETLVYPDEDKPTLQDVRFIVWDGGKHFYAKIGKLDVVDANGNQKWDTRQEAEKAAEWYIKKYWQ